MAEYLKSAFSYLSNQTNTKVENEFVGNSINIGGFTLKVKKVVAEGMECFCLIDFRRLWYCL